jgi:hypothetical protein
LLAPQLTLPFHLVVDVYEEEGRVDYATLPVKNGQANKLSAAIHSRMGSDVPLIQLAPDHSSCSCDLGNGPEPILNPHMGLIAHQLARPPQWQALEILRKHLAEHLPGYPLLAW